MLIDLCIVQRLSQFGEGKEALKSVRKGEVQAGLDSEVPEAGILRGARTRWAALL